MTPSLLPGTPAAPSISRRGERAAAELYEDAVRDYGAAIGRLAGAYEPDPDGRRDLVQEIHVALWRSFASFDGRCSMRTWVYRVAHNTALSLVARHRGRQGRVVSLEELDVDVADGAPDGERALDERLALQRLLGLIQSLAPLDRQVIVLYLEELDAAAIGEITGLSPQNVATKVHRIKRVLARRFAMGGPDAH